MASTGLQHSMAENISTIQKKEKEHVSSPAERLLAFQGRHAFWLI